MTSQFNFSEYFENKKEAYFKIKTPDDLLEFLKEIYFWPNILFYNKRDFSKFTLENRLQYERYAEDEINDYFDERAADFLYSHKIEEPEGEDEMDKYWDLQQSIIQKFNEILNYLEVEIIQDSIEHTCQDTNDHNIVFYFKPINLYLGATGYSWSNQRSDFDEDFYKVIQKEKLVTVWEKVE